MTRPGPGRARGAQRQFERSGVADLQSSDVREGGTAKRVANKRAWDSRSSEVESFVGTSSTLANSRARPRIYRQRGCIATSRGTSCIGNRPGKESALFSPVPPPLPGCAGFPTSHPPQVTDGRLGSEEVAVGQGKQKQKRKKIRKAVAAEMMQLTRRDERMLEWLNVVRMADIDGIRWALAGLKSGDAEEPVSARRANQWIARLAKVGLIDRVRPLYRDRQIVWPTHKATGQAAPTLFRQTMRHELAVAAVSARYLARGYVWTRDARPQSLQDHQADGVATKGDLVELVEVELTTKKLSRYRMIHSHHSQRMATGGVSRVVYFCTPDVARAVSREADKFIFRDERDRLVVLSVLDAQGKWIGDPANASQP